jgi:hypothetical protein
MKKIVLILAALALPVFAHQYTSLDDLVADVCAEHSFANCSDPVVDADDDGVLDANDQCPATPASEAADANGCSDSQKDGDNDGVTDDVDQCPNTPASATVDATGCEVVVPPPVGHVITDAATGVWSELPDTKLIDLVPQEAQDSPYRYLGSAKSILTAWNGASWDEARNEMHVVASGGHADYCGNQHFKLDADGAAWSLIRPHSQFDINVPGQSYQEMFEDGTTPDGNPIARHTWGGTIYAPNVDKHYIFPGSNCSGAGGSDNRIWSADPVTGETALVSNEWSGARNQGIYDPVTGKLFVANYGRVYSFDPTTNIIATEKPLGGAESPWRSDLLGVAIDPDRRTIIYAGGNKFYTFNIDTKVFTKHTDITLGIGNCYGPGLTFVESQDKYLAWCGGNSLYWLDPVTFAETEQVVTGSAPTKAPNGMFGRFGYSEKYNAIIVPDSVYTNVKFLKL